MIFAKAKGKRADIFVYESIGEGWVGGITAKDFAKTLEECSGVEALDIYINSPGGSVFDGLAIYNMLARVKAQKVVHIDGIAASIASVIAMAGDEIRIADNAMVMIHDAWGMAIGTADDMRKYADSLDKTCDSILSTYVSRTKGKSEDIRKMMADETWMNASEALAAGFATKITGSGDAPRASADALAKYRHTPAALMSASRNKIDSRGLLARMDMRVRRASPAKP
jgi:ATP-dependent Clp protease protease subunit